MILVKMSQEPSLTAAVEYLCRELAKARKELGIGQPELAKSLNVSRNTLGSWENCARRPSDDTLATWARELGCDVEISVRIETFVDTPVEDVA